MKPLLSHPNKPLALHLQEVAEAANIIAARHHLSDAMQARLDELVRLHDVGKATTFFQDYISFKPTPSDWIGNPKDKVHTTLGAIVASVIGQQDSKPQDWLLQLAPSVLGHHTQLPTRGDMDKRLVDSTRVLVKQLQDLPLDALSTLTGFKFLASDYEADDETVFTATDTYEDLFDWLDELELTQACQRRLQTQQLFSILLEADKAFLALSEDAQTSYKQRRFQLIQQSVIDDYIGEQPDSPVNALRTQARADALAQLAEANDKQLFTLTLPTGLGKTLTAASLALNLRQHQERKMIIVLPFLSIVDQTSKVYSEVLQQADESLLMQSHSLSARDYQDLEDGDADFFLDTWQSEIVITTFDQVLLALFSSKTKHQMRFHHLCDAVLIFDEVQALPTHLWHLVQQALKHLTEDFGSTVVAMSATQPGFVKDARELIPNVHDIFKHFGRYQLVLQHQDDMPLTTFYEMVIRRSDELRDKRVLLTLNTRSSARRVFDELNRVWEGPSPIYFLSADVTPKDRLAVINKLKEEKHSPCLVVSTQVVEAGVDLDMDLVMRDFAPLDSLIQVAGRCNRHNLKTRCNVEVYSVVSEKGKRYSSLVYRKMDGGADISLQETRKVLEGLDVVLEEDVLELCNRYFTAIRQLDNLGQTYTHNWAYFKEHLPVSKLLRGDQDNQYQFIVAERDDGDLQQDVYDALAITDRWDKRRALRKLAPRLAQVTVSVWGKYGFDPTTVAHQVGNFHFIRDGFYTMERGLDLGLGHADDSSFY